MAKRESTEDMMERHRREGLGWRYDGFGDWTTEAIFAKLAKLGIQSDPEQFRRDALAAGDVRPIVEVWKDLVHTGDFWEDFPYLTPTELWKRLLADVPCVTIVLDDLLTASWALDQPGGERKANAEKAATCALRLADLVRALQPKSAAECLEEWGEQRGSMLDEEILELPQRLQTEGLHESAVAVIKAWAPLLGPEKLLGQLAGILARAGKRQEAEAQIAEVEREMPDSFDIRMAVAEAWEDLSELDRALAAYGEAERLAGSEEDKEWALEGKANCLDDMGRIDEARKIREDAGLPDPGGDFLDEGDESDEPWPEFGGNVLPSPEYRREADEPPPPLTAGPKVGRNEPCPCGSGKKYKKCCGK